MKGNTLGIRYCPSVYQRLSCLIFLVLFLGGGVYYTYVTHSVSGVPGSGMLLMHGPTWYPKLECRKKVHKDQLQEEEYRSRIGGYQDMCAVRKKDVRSSSAVFFYKNNATNHSFSFCSVPKTGCTFWQRLLQFLNAPSSSNISSLTDVKRLDIYTHPLVKIHAVNYNLDKMADAVRFLFVRDPYSRLVSAYVDKIILTQFLTWEVYGKHLAKPKGNDTKVKPCIPDAVSFYTFIVEIVLTSDQNPHWKPMHTVCDPCKLFPNFIGKQESLSTDAKYILNKVGLQHVLSEYSHKTYVGDQIKQMVDFTYRHRDTNQYLRTCFNKTAIASRLWRAFQINGYLSASTMFPKSQMESLLKPELNTSSVVDRVTDVIVRENARAGMTRDQHSKQKRDMLVQEFATLSKDTMEKLADKYDIDFRMFGYEKYPKDLFPWKYLEEERKE